MTKQEFDIKQEYGKLCNRFKDLPSFDWLNKEFEIWTIEKPGMLTRQIRRRLNERLIFLCRILENLIYPSLQNVLSSYESNFFSDDEKKSFMELHRKLMVFERQNMLLDVNCNTEEDDVDFIISLVKEWAGFKSEVSKIIVKMEDSWRKEIKEEGEEYFG